MDQTKPCFNFKKNGFCRFAERCRFSHVIEQAEVLFSRMQIGTGLGEVLNKDVQVHLDSSKREELRRLLLDVNLEDNREEDEDIASGSPSFEHLSKVENSASISDSEKKFENKYSHIPDSPFKQEFKLNFLGNSKTSNVEQTIIKSSIAQDARLDFQLQTEILMKEENCEQYKQMQAFRRSLPAYEKKSEILDLIENNQVIVISGETGCGKTTQVAQFILHDYIMKFKGSLCHVVCTQPRRISAISVAQRVASEMGVTCGGSSSSVGYQVRLDKCLPRKQGSILFCTTGVLLKWMQSDPGLTTISHIIIDEIHERNVNSDFALIILREVLPQRPDLKLILMSATLNSHRFSSYFNNCPTLDIEGKMFHVDVYFLERVLDLTKYIKLNSDGRRRKPPTSQSAEELNTFNGFIARYVSQLRGRFSDVILNQLLSPESEQIDLKLILELIEYICREKREGAILIFLPGWEHISTLVKEINCTAFFCQGGNESETAASEYANEDEDDENCNEIITGVGGKFLVLPLHSQLPTVNQKAVFEQPPPGVRKIIVSTNIAETSITISDVVYVIDSGKMKVKTYDAEKNISALQDEWISQANATQRKGRAGRAQEGEIYHLYTKARYDRLSQFPVPEIQRMRLEDLVLHIKILQLGKVEKFLDLAMDIPDPKVMMSSIKFLKTLDALDDDEYLTPLGYHMARLPLDPQIGKMIIMGAIFSCVDPIFSVAACLSEKDPFYVPMGQQKKAAEIKLELSRGSKSDHLVCANSIKLWEEAPTRNTARKFSKRTFLSSNALRTLKSLKTEFAEILNEMGFLQNKYSKDPLANVNSKNESVVKAVICAGLHPNVAIVEKVEIIRSSGRVVITLKTPEDGTVKLHPVSINESARKFESPYLVYHKKLRSSNIYIHDTTMISSLPLIIFGHKMRRGSKQILVNDSVSFCCDQNVSILVENLRIETRRILDKLILNPGTVNWKANDQDTNILRSLIELITAEDEKILPKPTPEPAETKSRDKKK